MMAKKIKKIMAMVLALCICFSALPLQALAAEGDGTVETTEDGVKITTTTTTTETQKDPATGDTTVTITIQKESEGTKTSTGEKVDGSETKVTVKEKDSDGNEKVMSSETKSTTTVTDEDGKKVTTKVEDGYERTETEVPMEDVENVTVKVPLVKDDKPATEENEDAFTATTPVEEPKYEEGSDLPKNPEDKNYDYTKITEIAGSVTVDTTKVEVNQQVSEETDLDYTHTDATPDKDNDLFTYGSGVTIPDVKDVEAADGYQYVYLGCENDSQFYAAYLYKSAGYEGEEPVIEINGVKYYSRNPSMTSDIIKGKSVSGAYQNGEKVYDDRVNVIWDQITNFVMMDAQTGELITTYCADKNTGATKGFSYNMENIEDAGYYTEEQAAMIRTVAKNGYWGVMDDPNTDKKEEGSLEAMREMMRNAKDKDGNDIFTQAEIDALSDGVAMTATQYAIWSFSNYMDDFEFLNVRYANKNAENSATITYWGQLKDAPESEQASVDLLFKLYNHLVTMDPTELEGTTKDTVITAENFVKDMEITVLEKYEDKNDSKKDDSKKNNSYVTNLTFALVVEVDENNGDNLKVSVVDPEGNPILNAEGKPVVGRIAGELQDGEVQLDSDDDGNYCFQNIVLTEGENTFRLNLEGIQNLQEGVYLYSSEVTEEGKSSQTMVGRAGGKRGVSVSMDLTFELDVKEKVVVKERVWHSEKTNTNPPGGNVPPQGPNVPPQEPPQVFNLNREGVVEIIDEQVPLAAAPKTGDASFLFIALALFAAISLCAANFDKKRKHEAF